MADRTVRIRLEALISGFQQAFSQAGRSVSGLGTTVQGTTRKSNRAMQGMGPIAMGAGLAVAAGIGRAVSAASDFEREAIKLQTQIGLTKAEADGLADSARNIGTETGRGAQEMVEASFQIASAGLRGEDAMEALELAAQGARVGLGETRDIADLVTSAMNAYGSEVLSAEQATDTLLAAVKEGKAEAPEFAAAMGQVLPIASEMGVTFGEMAGNVAAMTRTGTNPATAVIQLRQILMGIMRPSEQARDALAEVGLTAQELRDQIREEGLFAALMSLKDAFGDNEEAMSEVFGNARSLMGVLDLLGANSEENARIVEAVWHDAAGGMGEAVTKVAETTADKTAQMGAAWEELSLTIGERVVPAVHWAIEDLQRTLDESGSLTDALFGGNMKGSPENILRSLAGHATDLSIRMREALGIDVPDWLFDLADDGKGPFGIDEEQLEHLDRYQGAMEAVIGVTASARGPIEETGAATRDTGEEFQTTADRIDEFNEALNAMFDPIAGARRAMRNLSEAQDAVVEAEAAIQESIAAGKKGTEEHTELVDDLAEARWREVEATFGAETALRDFVKSIVDGDVTFDKLDESLERHIELFGLSGESADAAREMFWELVLQADEIPDEVHTKVIAEAGDAESLLDRIVGKLRAIPREVHVDIIGTQLGAGFDPARPTRSPGRMHSGGLAVHGSDGASSMGLQPNEVVKILEVGERVLSVDQTEVFDRFLGMLGRTSMAGPVMHSGGVVSGTSDSSKGALWGNVNFYGAVPEDTMRAARHQARMQSIEMAY